MIFVTGGTGFLGTHLLRELIRRGEKVRALRRHVSKIILEKEITDAIDWAEGDVLDIMSIEEAMRGCEYVYHCAALVSFRQEDRNLLFNVNNEGTANIINICLKQKIKKLVHVSSVAAIGRNRDEVVNENTSWEEGKLNSNYAVSKFLAELEVWRGIAEGLDAVIVNPSLIVGSGNWNEGPPNFFMRLWKGMPYYSAGGTGIVAVQDVVKIMIRLMESDISGERFIINAEHWSFKDFFFFIADQLKRRRPFIHVKPWIMEILWRTEILRYKITGMPPLVNRETSRIASAWSRFDNSKVVNAIDYEFSSVKSCLEETGKMFLEDLTGKSVR